MWFSETQEDDQGDSIQDEVYFNKRDHFLLHNLSHYIPDLLP